MIVVIGRAAGTLATYNPDLNVAIATVTSVLLVAHGVLSQTALIYMRLYSRSFMGFRAVRRKLTKRSGTGLTEFRILQGIIALRAVGPVVLATLTIGFAIAALAGRNAGDQRTALGFFIATLVVFTVGAGLRSMNLVLEESQRERSRLVDDGHSDAPGSPEPAHDPPRSDP